MQGWKSLQSSLNLAQVGSKFSKGISQSVQATRERLGQVAPEDITELPQEYKDLESRVDALKDALSALQKVARIYEHESYDYPTQIQETISGITSHVGYNITSFAAQNLKNTNLPSPTLPAAPLPPQHKTLPHALTRAASAAHTTIANAPHGSTSKFGKGLALFAQGWDKVAMARVDQDIAIQDRFVQPWQLTLNANVSVAMKARGSVKVSRLDLDAAKQALKNANPARQEQARLEVENAEDDLVQKTEIAIQLMKAVLDNPEPLKNLNELVKAQLVYFSNATEALSAVQGEIEELGVAAEGEYRKSRDH